MRVKVKLALLSTTLFFLLSGLPCARAAAIQISEGDRVLVIAPHPDDETLGTGGLIQSALAAKAGVKVVYFTHGEYNEIASIFYRKKPLLVQSDFVKNGQIRKMEASRATAVLGLKNEDLIFLGYPDFGTMLIWQKHWGSVKRYKSFLTRINKVPHPEDFSYGSGYTGENIVRDLESVLLSYRPTQVFVTAPFDLNSDHQAAYLFLNVALFNIRDEWTPLSLYVYLVHAHRWPTPVKFSPAAVLSPPRALPSAASRGKLNWIAYPLTHDQIDRKKEAILRYESQMAYEKTFLLSFARANELFLELSPQPLSRGENGRKGGAAEFLEVGRELWLELKLSAPIDEIGALSATIFCYKHGTPFSSMPKIRMRLFGNHLFVRDGSRPGPLGGIHYEITKDRVRVRMPMELLKDPEAVFVSTHSTKEKLLFDLGSWKIWKR